MKILNFTKALVTTCLLLLPLAVSAQVDLDSCQRRAKQNYPLIKQFELIRKSEEFTLANSNKGYLPQLSLSAQATYQSDVTKLPIKIPDINISSPDKDQYRAELTLSQTIWDGGVIGSQKQITKASSEAEQREVESQLYQIRDRVNELYFGVLLLDAKLEQNLLFDKELERNHKQVTSFIEQGVANSADLDVVRVEILNNRQSRTNLEANRRAFIEMLSIFVGSEIDFNEEFMVPTIHKSADESVQINRPELQAFDARISELDSRKRGIRSGLTPKFDLFVTGGYGKPGLNMLKVQSDGYYIAGIRMVWNFGRIYTKKNDFRLVEIAKNAVNVQRESFLFNTHLELSQENNAIIKNRKLLTNDDEIVRLRTNIRKSAEQKLQNGTISTTDFMREVTAEEIAKQHKIEHQMELLMSIYKQKYISNN